MEPGVRLIYAYLRKSWPLIIIFISFIFSGCFRDKIRIRQEERISVTGVLRNSDSSALPEIIVQSAGITGEMVYGISNHELLGEDSSDSKGNISFISLDTYNRNFVVSVNPNTSGDYNPEYGTLYFVDLIDNHGTLVALDKQILRKKKNLYLMLENTSLNRDVEYKISYQNPVQQYLIENSRVTDSMVPGYQNNEIMLQSVL